MKTEISKNTYVYEHVIDVLKDDLADIQEKINMYTQEILNNDSTSLDEEYLSYIEEYQIMQRQAVAILKLVKKAAGDKR